MFDRYPGSNKEVLEPKNKVYKDEAGNLVLPAVNISSFLSAQNTESAPQRVMGKSWKTIAKAAQSFTNIDPFVIPFERDGKPIAASICPIDFRVARMMKGKLAIPNPKERPVLPTPWSLTFELTLFENPELKEAVLRKLFDVGGLAIGFGTYRGVYGKFMVEEWRAV
jgi:hypothetical protein